MASAIVSVRATNRTCLNIKVTNISMDKYSVQLVSFIKREIFDPARTTRLSLELG